MSEKIIPPFSLYEKLTLRCVVQRARDAEVVIEGRSQGKMPHGIVLLLGVGGLSAAECGISGEALKEAWQQRNRDESRKISLLLQKAAEKLLGLRIFSDAEGKMNLSLMDVEGGIYVISQFTLFGDCRKGFRPSFTRAAHPSIAEAVYEEFISVLSEKITRKKLFAGEFAAAMDVTFTNVGPVTLSFDVSSSGVS